MTSPNEHDDKRLVQRLLEGDEDAFEQFFEAMYPALHREARAASRAFGRGLPTRKTVVIAAAGIAAAAALIITLLMPSRVTQPPAPAARQIIGRVVRAEGVVRKTDEQAATNPPLGVTAVTAGEDVHAGATLDTSDTGRMAVALGPGISLRIDVDSRIVMSGERAVRLERGAVYIDATADKKGPVVVRTPHGDVRDIGTQFEVRAQGSSFGVRVREGEILINRDGAEMTARAGEGLHVDRRHPPGVQTLRVEAPGYEPASSPELKISPRRATTITIALIASPQFRENVMVTAAAAPPSPGVMTSSYGIASEEIPYSVKPREDTPGLTLDFTATAPITAAYVQASGQVLSRTTVTGGIRVTRFVELGDVKAYDPRGGVEFRVSSAVRVSVAGGRYHQQPELVTVVAVPSNANLAPIESDHLVGGVKYEPRPGLLLSAEVYRKWYRAYPVSLEYPQLTLANHGSEFNTSDLLLQPMASDGRGHVRGVEFLLKKRLAAGLYAQVAYSWSRTEQAALDGVFNRGSFDTPHVMTATGGYRLGERWEISGRFTYATGRPYTPPLLPESVDQNRLVYDLARFNAERLPAFHRLDLRIDRKFTLFWRNTSLFADMQNLYNRHAVIEYSWNQKTRELYAEKQLEFLPIVGINLEF